MEIIIFDTWTSVGIELFTFTSKKFEKWQFVFYPKVFKVSLQKNVLSFLGKRQNKILTILICNIRFMQWLLVHNYHFNIPTFVCLFALLGNHNKSVGSQWRTHKLSKSNIEWKKRKLEEQLKLKVSLVVSAWISWYF